MSDEKLSNVVLDTDEQKTRAVTMAIEVQARPFSASCEIIALRDRVAAKDREIAELKENAERYLYIRDLMPRPVEGQVVWMRRGDDLDEAIDAEMKERT